MCARRQAVYTGGYKTATGEVLTSTFIYELDGNFWRPGAFLPEPRRLGRAVQYGVRKKSKKKN